jgi:hypothetical protein
MVVADMINMEQENVKITGKTAKIDATGIYYRDLNNILRGLDANGIKKS